MLEYHRKVRRAIAAGLVRFGKIENREDACPAEDV